MYMDYITTTDLRTKSSELVQALEEGHAVKLVHRSKIVGIISPPQNDKPFDVDALKALLKKMKPFPEISEGDRKEEYRKHMEKKYGKGVS
jgi:antitoxin (DNA-binding transcriptional repressor) of toxin-antitoxin stability system